MSFASPFLLLTLLVVPLLAGFAYAIRRRRSRYPIAFTNLDILAKVTRPERSVRRWVPTVLVLLALVCAAAAVARPRINTTVSDAHSVVVILVDVSGSMQANDIAPTRIDAAVRAMQTFVQKLPSHAEVGLVEFSTQPATIELPTTDHGTVLNALSLLSPQGGTAIGDGIASALQAVQAGLAKTHATRPAGAGTYAPAAIVLLSDGAQTRGVLGPLEAARGAKKAGIRIYTVAYGTARGRVKYQGFATPVAVPPDPATMRAIARLTGGEFFTAESAEEATSIYGHLGSTIARTHSHREITSWLSLGAAVLLLAGLGAGAALSPVLL